MARHWVLAILFTVQAVLPIGGGACPCAVMAPATAHDCCCDCDPADTGECCYDAEKQPANDIHAILTEVQQTTPRLFVLTEALPQPTIVADTALALERSITPCDFLICLTRAERAPPA